MEKPNNDRNDAKGGTRLSLHPKEDPAFMGIDDEVIKIANIIAIIPLTYVCQTLQFINATPFLRNHILECPCLFGCDSQMVGSDSGYVQLPRR